MSNNLSIEKDKQKLGSKEFSQISSTSEQLKSNKSKSKEKFVKSSSFCRISDETTHKSFDYSSKSCSSHENSLESKNFHVGVKKGGSCKSFISHTKSVTRAIGSKITFENLSNFTQDNNHQTISTSPHAKTDRCGKSAYGTGLKTIEHQSTSSKITGHTNFPPLRAPQSIVNIKHPFVTEVSSKNNDSNFGNASKIITGSSLSYVQSNIEEIESGRQSYSNFGSNTINLPGAFSEYHSSESFSQQTIASAVYPESSRYNQSCSSYSTNQINPYQTFDPANYHTSTSVISSFSDNSLSYPQYDNSTFLQSNHYQSADLGNNQFQYQTPSVGQVPDSSMYIQNVQNSLPVNDQYVAPSYARALKTESISRMRRNSRFTK